MKSKTYAENYSSQQDDKRVFGRIKRRAAGRGFFAVPQEGASFFIFPSLAEKYSLSHNQELSESEFTGLKLEASRIRVQMKAVDLLARREHS
ncbi:MAG: hypothetical protein PF495_01805, partial [Spirochaetales bacterium]|nr:hypothetical protein [Spirochaetales bacterium]